MHLPSSAQIPALVAVCVLSAPGSPAQPAAAAPTSAAPIPATPAAEIPAAAVPLPPVQDAVVVGTRVVPPFVIDEGDGSYSGLTVHLWEHLAGELGLEFRFEERDIQGMLGGVEDRSLFASASALTITAEREERVDFTHPFYVTGLGIAVPRQPAGAWQALRAFFSADFLWVVLLLGGLLLLWGFLVWLFERKANPDEFGGSPAQGIGAGFWWAAVTMTTVGYGDKAPRTVGGRAVGFVWMFAAIIVISFFTASIASSLTVTQLDSRVTGPQDLPDARVGGLEGSAAVEYLVAEGVRTEPFSTIHEGLAAVEEGALDAFVHDAPILRYHTQEDFRNRVRVLPRTFVEQYYGIAIPLDAPYRNDLNRALLDYLASDEWGELVRRYLGED